MRKLLLFPLILFLTACAQQQVPAVPTNTSADEPPLPAATLTPEPAATQTTPAEPTADAEPTAVDPGPTEAAQNLPDLSGVTVFETTHLMDPRYFQVALAGWPEDLPQGITVMVGSETYDCDLLFPEEYPDRLYCWGLAPERGTQVSVVVMLDEDTLLEISFTVP